MDKNTIEEFKDWAEKNGWTVKLREEKANLSEGIRERYQNIPKEWDDFISCFANIMNNSENMWFLTYDDYREGDLDDEIWNFNDFEKISLEAAEDDEEWEKSIKAFWDNRFTIMMSVTGDYQYYAIEMDSGKVVLGWEPEFEEVTYVADSFEEFVKKIVSGEIELVV